MTDVRKGQAPEQTPRGEFALRFRRQFFDPAFETEAAAIDRLEEIAWQAYKEGPLESRRPLEARPRPK